MAGDIIILKFGSSVLHSRKQLPAAVHEIYRWYRAGWHVVAVVSALDNTTETLLAEARELSCEPEQNATAELLATGERHCAALLGIALDRGGIRSRVIDPREIGLTTIGAPLDSEPVNVDRQRIEALLAEYAVIVVPGFFGYGENGRLHLLGRGGSDLSAVYLANALRANRCRLLKDVDGVYEHDPMIAASTPTRRFASLGYAQALDCAQQLIQPKAVRFLERHSASAEVAALASPYESIVGPLGGVLVDQNKGPPLSVLILGLGTVGFGVYQRLMAMPEHFRFVGALVRNRDKHAAQGVPRSLLFESQDELATVRADIVVDALPGLQPSQSLVRYYLAHGVSVASANKMLIAEAGVDLAATTRRGTARLLYSAAVGGSAPMIETLRRETQHGRIHAIAGVLNGTCNYVLDRCAEGLLLNEAVQAAQACGFAEADPAEDLSGRDAARKLRILARVAFGQDPSDMDIEPLNTPTLLRLQATLRSTESLRHIARAWNLGERVFGQVELEIVAADDVFAQTKGEWNRLQVSCTNGENVVVTGRGAGRWPTTEAVMADLLELITS